MLPQFLTPGPDGNVWFTEIDYDKHSLGRVTPDGTVTEFHIADTLAGTNVVATGADGDLWFTEAGTSDGDIWRMHPNGALIGTSIPVHFNPIGLALGPDGNLWFTSRESGEIGRDPAAPAAGASCSRSRPGSRRRCERSRWAGRSSGSWRRRGCTGSTTPRG